MAVISLEPNLHLFPAALVAGQLGGLGPRQPELEALLSD